MRLKNFTHAYLAALGFQFTEIPPFARVLTPELHSLYATKSPDAIKTLFRTKTTEDETAAMVEGTLDSMSQNYLWHGIPHATAKVELWSYVMAVYRSKISATLDYKSPEPLQKTP